MSVEFHRFQKYFIPKRQSSNNSGSKQEDAYYPALLIEKSDS